MRRSIETWKGLIPEVVARGCRAQCEFCIADAQHDIIELFDANMNWANSDVLKVTAERDELLDLLTLALPYVEEAEWDKTHKPGAVEKLTKRIRAAVEERS